MTVANRSRALVARLACALAMAASAPEVFALWPASGGGPLNDSAFATVTDQSGNIYVAGEFRGVANFGGTDYSAEGLSDLFVAKYSPDGALIYVRTAGGPSVDRATALAVDAAQNVYLTGYFTTSAGFKNLPSSGVATVNLPDPGNDEDFDRHEWFIARLAPNGDWSWARQIGGPGQDEGYGIAIAPGVEDPNNPIADGVIAVGRTSCAHLFESDGDISPIGSLSCGRSSGVAVRLDTAGNWVWALEAGQANASEWLTGVAIDANGLVYVSGLYQETTSIATGPPTALPFTGVAAGGTLEFWQKRDFESAGTCWDSGVLEYSSDAVNWYDILSGEGDNDPSTSTGNPARFTANGYNGATVPSGNPLSGRQAWCHPNGGYLKTTVNLADFSSQSVRFRWRFGSDASVGHIGWKIDDVKILDGGSNVLFADDIESGPGKWSVSSPTPTSSPWATSTGDPHAGSTSWFLPDPPLVSDHRLQMLNAVALPEGKPSYFVAKIGGTEVNSPFWQWATPMGQGISIGGIAVNDAGKLFVAGTSENAPSTFGGQSLATNGAFLARLQDNGGSFTWDWVRGATGGQGRAVAVAADGDAFLFGQYASNTTTFDPVQTLAEDDTSTTGPVTLPTFGGARDLFVARIASAGSKWRWVQTAHPAGGTETASGIAAGTNDQLYVVGDFDDETTFGEVILAPQGGSDVFIANLGARTGEWFEVDFQNWIVGQEVLPPAGVGCLTDPVAAIPDIVIAGGGQALQNYFYWSPPGSHPGDGNGHLYAVQPVDAEIKWKVTCTLTDSARIIQTGRSSWPRHSGSGELFYCGDAVVPPAVAPGSCIQAHIAGAPVEIEPAGSGIAYAAQVTLSLPERSTDATVTVGGEFQSRFTATVPGYSVILYTGFPPSRDLQSHPPIIQIIRSLPYDTGISVNGSPVFTDAVSCRIGEEIFEPTHADHGGKNGFVVFDRAYFDGDGPDRAYDRATRLGQIVPVNQVPVDSNGLDLMAVAWYQKDARDVAWPARSKRYDCRWPANPDKIIIASELGSEVLGQTPLNPLVFTGMRIYNQPNRAKSGFNPNDEHAIFAPANSSSGFNALYAIRSDFSEVERNKTSKPYSILKYIRPDNGKWAYRIYQVAATGAGYESFQYPGTAGNAVFAPYPVRLLGNCPQNEATGTPAFKDYKNQVWAKSAGTMIGEYWYPLQPVFYYDRDANGAADTQTPDCVSWLGGIADDPVDVTYNIVWPTNAPVLLVGETLLGSKRGLPEIAAQAAVEIVFDEKQQRTLDNLEYDPTKSLVRLIDPLEQRFVYLNAIPDSVATDIDPATGKLIPYANSEGTIQLPATIVDRISYDPLNRKLIFEGILDESGAGDPFLLLNVLTETERQRLKQIDGGDGTEQADYDNGCDALSVNCTWDQAIESLYRLSRNPKRLDFDLDEERCHLELEIDPTTSLPVFRLVCAFERDGEPDNGLLLGLQDEDDDGVPEPLQVVGFTPALTAGFAQGTGYVTLAFNNDITLSPLPVSLNVIRVECLQIPPDIESTYQGQINVLPPANLFAESLTLRHSGDFAGNVDGIEFEWFIHPDEGGLPPSPLPDPDNGQLHGWLQFTSIPNPVGAIDITIEGANIQTLSDNWIVARYRYVEPPMDAGPDLIDGTSDDAALCGGTWSVFAGQPGGTALDPRAQLAEGWIKRVVRALNPFEARVQDFHAAETNTYSSMLYQLGERYEGDIAFNPDAGNLNSIGLIEAYTTVLNRGKNLSIDGTPPIDYAPANQALLLVAARIADFYTLLGNEAYADAQDPMIGFGTGSGIYGTLAPTIFAFQNQLDSLLAEELALLRGRDNTNTNTSARPVYNRLYWNFTSGDGEFAYALAYNITDQDLDGNLNEFDARILYPQGHGDAWGHYLTAMTTYYGLLRHPFYTWLPRPEAVSVAGVPIQVDFLDERKFARAAAMKARAGAEIVNLTYRSSYVEDPAGQWQGYKDTDPDRAWGLSEWSKRAGQGAYFDWVVGNAILPAEDPDPAHVGIQKVDRKTVKELAEILTQAQSIQLKVDEADRGLNPLGLAKGVVPFDIDPTFLDVGSNVQGQTHFEQVFKRAEKAFGNAVSTFNHANLLTELIRRTQDSSDSIYSNNYDQEIDYKNRLIEIYGYPYDADIGPGGTYPTNYDGPDIYHYMYVDQSDLTGSPGAEAQVFTVAFPSLPAGIGFFDFDPSDEDEEAECTFAVDSDDCSLASEPATTMNVSFSYAVPNRSNATAGAPDVADSFFLVKPPDWGSSQRRAPGNLQGKLSDLLLAMNSYQQAIGEYDNLIADIQDAIDLLETQYDVKAEEINIKNGARGELQALTALVETFKSANIVLRRIADTTEKAFKTSSKCIPDSFVAGLAAGGDIFSGADCAIAGVGGVVAIGLNIGADALEIVQNAMDAAKEDVEQQASIEVDILGANFEILQASKELEKLIRDEPLKRLAAFAVREQVDAARGNYQIELANGQRTISEMIQFRKNSAADIQSYRYRDMAFRIFRNDALQKYRAQFDLAARYAYLAATAYDYETNLLGADNASGREFLTQIVRERSLGQIIDGVPVPGSRGLAGPMGQMAQNFDVLKSQLGFNNPQIETNRFSLRREAFRLLEDSDEEWADKLENEFRVDDLWQIPEFRRFCKPFAPESAGPQPGLVIPFETTVTFGLNFFGWPLGPGDSAYDPSHFSTRIRQVGSWFTNYSGLPLSNTPRVYVVPVGADVLRSPSDDLFATREWRVVDQVIPVPFPLGANDLDNPTWIPSNDTLSDSFAKIRRVGAFRAYHTDGIAPVNPAELSTDSRLIGRSVWNSQWLMIIPGGTLLNDPETGLDTFIHGQLVPGGTGERDGNGVKDIQLFFSTYAYTGN
ncbi:MAG: hypothetical protein KBI44_04515 [Thermoanaerobaculia bacterium]|nr:hypothetical protein [Thermoanaerobaculia bacterium]